MPSYDKKLEYILDHGLECRCCPLRKECDGKVKHTANGPVLPACADTDFKDLLTEERVREVYRMTCVKGG